MKQATLLVPFDFSDVAYYALNHGMAMAQTFNYNLDLLHVINKKDVGTEKEDAAKTSLKALASHIKGITGLGAAYHIKTGNIFDTISEVADELEAAFVVMGVRGKKGVSHIVGSYPYKVVCKSKVPVLIVKAKHRHKGFRNIVIPIDFSRKSVQKVAQATRFAKFFGANIRVFGFLSSENKAKIINKEALLKSVNDFFIEKGISVTTDLMINPKMDWDEALISFAEKIDADLIMIVAERGNRFQDIFTSNYTERILDRVNVPVLTILPGDEELAEETEAISSKQGFVTPFVDPLGFFMRG
jgi:nucleotide-binding universal stress UspA family protein